MTLAQNNLEQHYNLLPTRSDAELRLIHQQGFSRYGIVAMLLDDKDRMLLLEHAESDKANAGMWGALGETSQVYHDNDNGLWQVEPAVRTVLRGIKEEAGADVCASELSVSASTPYFETTWPIGTQYGNKKSFAVSPIITLSALAVEQIMDAQIPEGEITAKQFVNVDHVSYYRLRPGMTQWLQHAKVACTNRSNDTIPLASEPWTNATNIQDAKLTEMF